MLLLLLELGLLVVELATAGPGPRAPPAGRAASSTASSPAARSATQACVSASSLCPEIRICKLLGFEASPATRPRSPRRRTFATATARLWRSPAGDACKRLRRAAATAAAELGLGRLGGDRGRLVEALAVLGRLHPRDDQALDLGRALEQLVDLRVAEPLLERAVAWSARTGRRGPSGCVVAHIATSPALSFDIEPWPPVIGMPLRPIQAARWTSSRAASISVATSASTCWIALPLERRAPAVELSSSAARRVAAAPSSRYSSVHS